MLACFLMFLLCQEPAIEPLPQELRAAFAARQSINAQIDWEITAARGSPVKTHYGRNTYVGADGAYVVHYPDLPPLIGTTEHAMFRGLYQDGRLFENDGAALVCELWDDPRRGHGTPMDFRVVGMHPLARTAPAHDPFAPGTDAAPRYEVSEDDGLVKVSRLEELRSGTRETRWWIDPRRDWNVVRCERLVDGRPSISVVSALAKFGDHWFPQTVEYRSRDDTPRLTVRIRDLKRDQADLPARLTPAYIGVVPGTNITRQHVDGSSEGVRFDGRDIISVDEFKRRQKAGELVRGPAFIAALAELKDENARRDTRRKRDPSLWEEYVQRFITWHQLDDAQATRAWGIYRDCRDQADRHLDSHKSDFERLARQQSEQEVVGDNERAAGLRARVAELCAPIERIFSERLVPRLDRLLTRRQRERTPSATRPSTNASSPSRSGPNRESP